MGQGRTAGVGSRTVLARGLWSAAVVVVAVIGLGACGDDDEGEAQPSAADAPVGEVVIRTRIVFEQDREAEIGATGEVLDGSTVGDAPFCAGGTFEDRHGDEESGSVDRTYRCSDGTLRMGFTPGAPEGMTQAGPWEVLSGTGRFEGITGSGEMEIEYDESDEFLGHETFTGSFESAD